MACKKTYTPSDFYRVNRILERSDWRDKINGKFDNAAEVIAAIESGAFDENFGRLSVQQIVSSRDPLSNAVDVISLKTYYVTIGKNKSESGFDRMSRDFKKNLIEKVLIDKNTLKMIDANAVSASGITTVNKNLFEYKMDLISDLWDALFPGKELDRGYQGQEAFTKLISDVLSAFESRMLTDDGIGKLWDKYFQLKFFDQLISDFSDFITIKPEYQKGRYKSNKMYEYKGPYVKYDTSFNPDEFASADQYASSFIKTLLDSYFKKIDLDGRPLDEAIGFDDFNYAITKVVQWAESSTNPNTRRELWNDVNIDWSELIYGFIKFSDSATPDIVRILKGIEKIIGRDSILDNKIKEILTMQTVRTVKFVFEGFRKGYDPKLGSNVIIPIKLDDVLIDKQKGSVARAIRYRVLKAKRDKKTYANLKAGLGISFNNGKFWFKGYGPKGRDLVLTVTDSPNDPRLYDFTWNVYYPDTDQFAQVDGRMLDQDKVKRLIETLFQIPIDPEYTAVLGTSSFATNNLFDVFREVIALTVSASESAETNFPRYSFRYNGLELEMPKDFYYSTGIPAKFISLMNGIQKRTNVKNGLGNNLPLYQQRSGIQNAKRSIEKALINFEHIRSNIWKDGVIIPRKTIYDDSILRPDVEHGVPIGSIAVRADYDAGGSNKNSAQMNFRELTYLDIFKSYYYNLQQTGNIKMQSTCLSDKRTHFLVEYLTKQIRIGGTTLESVLKNLASADKTTRDDNFDLISREIKSRRRSKTRVSLVNLLNRYEVAFWGVAQSTVGDSFKSLQNAITRIEDHINSIGLAATKKAFIDNNSTQFTEADLVTINGKTHINETLYNSFLTYCSDDSTKWNSRIASQQMAFAKDLFQNHFVIDTVLDPYLRRTVKTFAKTDPTFYKNWYNERTGIMKSFIIRDAAGNEVIPTYRRSDIDTFFNSDEYTVELNPVLLSYWSANALLSDAFNDIVFGEDYGLENKYANIANKNIKKWAAQRDAKQAELNQVALNLMAATSSFDVDRLSKRRDSLVAEIAKLNQDIADNDYGSDNFFTFSEASRLSGHYKRTVHGGATYTPLVQGMHYGVSEKVKVAVLNDLKDELFTLSGNLDEFTAQDGAGWTSPYMSRMENVSYVDGAVGKNKKTIYSYVDPETGVLRLIKWAEYEITNAMRRDSPEDGYHMSYEAAFRKMHSIEIEPSVFDGVDLSSYYNLEDSRTTPLYVYNPETGEHRLITRIENNGNSARAYYKVVSNTGEELSDEITGDEILLDSIYKLDQLFGGAYTETMQADRRLDWSEAQNDLVHRIICDLDLKNHFIGFLVNASAIKSGMSNNNEAQSLFAGDSSELSYFEMPTTTGGAQMNADHIITESEVTEMSQMVSALVQRGLKTRRVGEIYKFIGKVAAESLGDVVSWVDDPSKLDSVYQWIGEALARSFESGSEDTLGLAGAFIAKANKNLESHGLKTRIPLSAPTVKGKFEATISSLINKRAISRKYPGGGFVQVPTFDAKLRYTFNGRSMSYTEFQEANRIAGGMSTRDVLNNSEWDPVTKSFKNPYIKVLSLTEVSSLDIDDTVIVYDLDEFGNAINQEVIRLNTFTNWSKVRHFSQGRQIAHWTCRPKNLRGNRNFFNVGNQKFSFYDLDSSRAAMYAFLIKDGKEVPTEFAEFLQNWVAALPVEVRYDSEGNDLFDLATDEGLDNAYKYARYQTREDLKKLSRINEVGSGEFKAQKAFSSIDSKVVISNIAHEDSEVLMGIAEAEAFGIENREDLEEIERGNDSALAFFKRKLMRTVSYPEIRSASKSMYDGVLHGANGSTALLIVRELHGDKLPSGLRPDITYTVGDDNHIWHLGEDYGNANGKDFYKYTGNDGVEYDVLVVNTMDDYNQFNTENKLYTTMLPNANINNWQDMAESLGLEHAVDDHGDVIPDEFIYYVNDPNRNTSRRVIVSDPGSLNLAIKANAVNQLNSLAAKKLASWKSFKKGIGTRIPSQSMQSFTSAKIVGFTDDVTTAVHVSTMLCFMQGSDFK